MSINHEKHTLVIVDEYSRKSKTPIEAARTMLSGYVFSKQYWTEAIANACYTQNTFTIVKRHLKTPYEIFRGILPNINFLHVFGYSIFIHNYKDHLGKFDEKANDGYFLGYSLVSKAFTIFNTRRQQTEETYQITFDESTTAIKISKPSVDVYLHPYEPSQRYQVDSNVVQYIEPYKKPEPIVIEADASIDQNDQADQNEHHVQTDEILTDDQLEHPNHNNDNPNAILIPIGPYLSIPSMASPAPQDRWSNIKHIELVNIIGNPTVRMLNRVMAKELSAASAHECLFLDFLSEEEPKKVKQSERGISINQEKNVKDLLNKYDINDSPVKTLMVPPNNLEPDLNGKSVNETQYRGMIGSLMYLTASRPDIKISTCICARYQANLKESHLIAIKRIFMYLKGTLSLGLWYLKCSGFNLKGYSDSDYAGCNMDRKSTSSACQLVGGKLVCWMLKSINL
uniref:Uncharacterized mitochondrial protein AtMg00810-like n=1 Tax=Tanacetum cinerariifolium TaxID=118510 RepID=A0A699GW41_TANCI|nr:uncharacterized mitochondrial protein AtMg00810-like [Tanacetum cinerariifolium]